ncbi:hypothetical protein [Pistricoccus aurantiacus]|uniref:hypothetical protein n=1 Tax=Pistricoccus aurantiacus TaxID=1883414 RepID=UPI0036421B27
MQRGIALGVVFLSCLYVAGYIYKYSFFSLMTYEIGWVDLDPSDYIAWGVYSLIDFFRINIVVLVISYAAALTYFSDVVSFLYKVRGRIFLGSFGRDAARVSVLSACVLCYYGVGSIVMMGVAKGVEGIESMARHDVNKFLQSSRVDVMCQTESKNCIEGKLFYTGGNDYIFYEHDNDVYSGEFHVAHKRNVYVQVGWNENSRASMRELGEIGKRE